MPVLSPSLSLSLWMWMTTLQGVAMAEEDTPINGTGVDGGNTAPVSSEVSSGGNGTVDVATNEQLDLLEQRLLGEIPTETGNLGSTPYETNEISGLVWVFPLFVFMVALIVWSKIRKQAPINPGEIRVLSKTPLGKEGSLAVIVVGEQDGAEQKMLVGLSEQGAPRLLSVLDAKWSERNPTDQAAAQGSFDAFLSEMPPVSSNKTQASSQTTADPKLEDRKDLVDELLTARGIQQYNRVSGVSIEDSNSQAAQKDAEHSVLPADIAGFDFGEEEDSVVDDDPWVVNFRRKYQQS